MVRYEKAVRDRIPPIIEADGKSCEVVTLEPAAFLPILEAKLQEELDEYQASKDLGELADLLEVIYAIGKLRGVSQGDLERIRITKRAERGGFDERLFLVETRET